MPRSKSSKQWLKEHFSDQYVKQSKIEGYRSRAAYKLLAIQEKDHLIRSGMNVVDLGAAPGGWSQVAAKLVGDKGHVFALDILPIDSIANVTVLQGDFREQSVLDSLLNLLHNKQVDLVISDMAPNMSGIKDVDQASGMYLAELALEAALILLKRNGDLLVKVFQGEGFDNFLRTVKEKFTKVSIRKPEASRARSKEQYIVAKGFRDR